jgi:AcrR family transcriptional regulator
MNSSTPGELSPYNKRGQRLGAKGIATRTSIMNTTLELLRDIPLWQLTPSDIASACQIQQPNFYTYFDSIEEVILALAFRAASEAPDLKHEAPAELTGAAGLAWIRRVVEAQVAEWQAYGPALRIVEMLADDDVPAFRQARRQRLDSMRDILAGAVTRAQHEGKLPSELNVRFVVYATLSLIRVAAEHYNLTRAYPMSHDEIVNTSACLSQLLLTGQTQNVD